MNAATAKQTVKQRFQALADQQRQQYYSKYDYLTGRPLAALATETTTPQDQPADKQQRDLDCLNALLYPTPTLGSVLGDSLAAIHITPATPDMNDAPLAKPSENLVNRAKHWFDQYRTDGLESLLPQQAGQLTAANIAILKHALGHNTLLLRNVCMLSAFWIRSPQDWQAQGSAGLPEHLFMRYEVPAFLKPCWSLAMDEDSVRWLLCYLMYAQGGSLKTLTQHFGWAPHSKKLWHQLFLCPAHLSPLQAVLQAEFKRLGGWDEDFACLLANESYVIDLLEPASADGRDFWYDTCRWTISHQFELTAAENRKVLWWARHQYTERARRGECYRLQGRSKAKVMESITVYEQAQAQIRQARARMAERARQVSMAREAERQRLLEEAREQQEMREALLAQRYEDDYDNYEPLDVSWNNHCWNWSTTAHGKRWKIVELTCSEELYAEGEAMEHCVGGYSLSCVDGHAAIFSLRSDGYRAVTIEIDPLCKELVQVQGRFNAEPNRAAMSVVKAWMERVVKR